MILVTQNKELDLGQLFELDFWFCKAVVEFLTYQKSIIEKLTIWVNTCNVLWILDKVQLNWKNTFGQDFVFFWVENQNLHKFILTIFHNNTLWQRLNFVIDFLWHFSLNSQIVPQTKYFLAVVNCNNIRAFFKKEFYGQKKSIKGFPKYQCMSIISQ